MQSKKFLFKIVLTRNSSFCNFVFGCNNPTYNPSLIRLFIILTAFFSSKVFGIGFVFSLGVITPLIPPVMLSKIAPHFRLVFGCEIPTY